MSTTELNHGWAGAANGPVTVVLHGGGPGCHPASDFAALMALRPHRRWLWVDLPGYGGSPAHTDASASRLSTAARALDELLTRRGCGPVDVVAQSLGGVVALHLAADHPELLRRLVLIGSQPVPAPGGRDDVRRDPSLGLRARAQYYGGTGPSVEKMRKLFTELEWYDANLIPEATVEARYQASTTPAALAAATASAPVGDPDLDPGAVAAPTLVVWGSHDPFGGPDYASALADALPRGDLAVVGRTAHHPQAERPATVAALTEAFLTDWS